MGQFDIVEEYTIDDNTVTSSSPSVETCASTSNEVTSVGEHSSTVAIAKVETVPPSETTTSATNVTDVPSSSASATPSTGVAKPQVVYGQDITDFYVGTRMKRAKTESLIDYDEVASPSTYPWKKKLIIRLKRLSDFDINLWCKTPYDTGVHDKLQVETGSSIKQEAELQVSTVMHVMGDGLRTGSKRKHSQVETEPDTMAIPNSTSTESTSQLIAQANQLINKVSAALDITPDIPQQSIPSSRSDPAPPSNMETPAPFKRTVRCKLCSFSCDSVRGLNEHHKEDHGIVTCTICGKNFETKMSLDKHMYCHTKDNAFCCEECGQSFPFKSRLIQHQITHTREPLFMCKHYPCEKGFKNKGDLNRHMKSHGNIWYNCRTCTYHNKDKRNRDSHERTHEEEGKGLERYSCERCGKPMRISTQRQRHREAGCNPKDLHVQTTG